SAQRSQSFVRRLGNELDGLQHRTRRAVARRKARSDQLLHVPAGRNRQRPDRQPRSGRVSVLDHGQGTVTVPSPTTTAGPPTLTRVMSPPFIVTLTWIRLGRRTSTPC